MHTTCLESSGVSITSCLEGEDCFVQSADTSSRSCRIVRAPAFTFGLKPSIHNRGLDLPSGRSYAPQRVKIPLPLASFRPARSCAAREKFGKVFSLSRTPIRASLTLRGDCFRNLKLQRPKIMVCTLTSPSFRTVCLAVVQL